MFFWWNRAKFLFEGLDLTFLFGKLNWKNRPFFFFSGVIIEQQFDSGFAFSQLPLLCCELTFDLGCLFFRILLSYAQLLLQISDFLICFFQLRWENNILLFFSRKRILDKEWIRNLFVLNDHFAGNFLEGSFLLIQRSF